MKNGDLNHSDVNLQDGKCLILSLHVNDSGKCLMTPVGNTWNYCIICIPMLASPLPMYGIDGIAYQYIRCFVSHGHDLHVSWLSNMAFKHQ